MLLNHAARHLKLDSYLHALQRHAQRLSAHELLTLGQNDVQVALQNLTHVCLLEVLAEGDVLGLQWTLLVLLRRPVSIFNQKRGISNNWSAMFIVAYFEKRR